MDGHFVDITDVDQLWGRPLDRAPTCPDWDTRATSEPRMHRIHPYPAKFPAFLAERGIQYARGAGVHVSTVGDLFCGCGTVAHEARRMGLNFWGCDINPVATLIARTKSANLSSSELMRTVARIETLFTSAACDIDFAPSARERLQRWFRAEQFADLCRLLNSIRRSARMDSPLHEALLCVFSSILKPCSQWQQRAIKPTLSVSKTPPGVLPTFVRQAESLALAIDEAGDLSDRPLPAIHLGSALTVDPPEGGVDLLVSSPPYVTSYEYADLHQLSSLFLGYADDYRILREGSIGSTHHHFRLRKGVCNLNGTAARVVFSLYEHDKRAAQSIANYFVDMQQIAVRARCIVRPGGIAMFVIGNTQYHGVDIDNAGHLVEAMLHAGFKRVRALKRTISNKAATPYRTPTGRFSRSRTANHIYAHEYVLMAHR